MIPAPEFSSPYKYALARVAKYPASLTKRSPAASQKAGQHHCSVPLALQKLQAPVKSEDNYALWPPRPRRHHLATGRIAATLAPSLEPQAKADAGVDDSSQSGAGRPRQVGRRQQTLASHAAPRDPSDATRPPQRLPRGEEERSKIYEARRRAEARLGRFRCSSPGSPLVAGYMHHCGVGVSDRLHTHTMQPAAGRAPKAIKAVVGVIGPQQPR